MNTRIILASASFLVLGALTAAPSFASVDRAAAAQLLADDSIDVRGDDGSLDKGSGDVSLVAPSALPAPMLLAEDGAGDSGSASSASSEGHGHGEGEGSSVGHGDSGHGDSGHGNSGHGDSGHASGHSSGHGDSGHGGSRG